MRRVLATIALSLLVIGSGLAQWRKLPVSESPGGYPGGFHKPDTIFTIQESFDYNSLDGWTEVGDVDIVVHPTAGVVTDSVLKATVSGGGQDYIYQTVTERPEYRLSYDFLFTSADTSSWDVDDQGYFSGLYHTSLDRFYLRLGITWKAGATKWKWYRGYRTDAGSSEGSVGSLESDTWYSILLHHRASSAPGADDGLAEIFVDGVSLWSSTSVDNDGILPGRVYAGNGYTNNSLNGSVYIKNVRLWTPEGLP